MELDFLIEERDFLDQKTKETTNFLIDEIVKVNEDKKKNINQIVKVFLKL